MRLDQGIPETEATNSKWERYGVPKGIRTPVTAVKGRCPRPLDDGDVRRRWSNWPDRINQAAFSPYGFRRDADARDQALQKSGSGRAGGVQDCSAPSGRNRFAAM